MKLLSPFLLALLLLKAPLAQAQMHGEPDPATEPAQSGTSEEEQRRAKAKSDYTAIKSYAPNSLVVPMLQKVSAQFGRRDFKEALATLDEIDRMQPDLVDAVNARGAVYAEMHDFERAKQELDRARVLDPKSFWPQFNLSEILFMQKEYAKARDGWKQTQKRFPGNDLIRFKILLTYLMEKNEGGVSDTLESMSFLGESPFTLYAQAAIAFSRGKKDEGETYLESAENKFGKGKWSFLYYSLADQGWVERGNYAKNFEK